MVYVPTSKPKFPSTAMWYLITSAIMIDLRVNID